MPFKFEFDGATVREWHATADGAEYRAVDDYLPSLYVRPTAEQFDALAERLAGDPKVVAMAVERKFCELDADERSRVLRVDVERLADVTPLAREIKHDHERALAAPGTYRLYNVDLAPQFRYALETDTSPVPSRELRRLRIDIPEQALADGEVTAVEVDGDPVGDDPASVLEALARRLDRVDPDVLVLQTADLVPFLSEAAARHGVDLQLGRLPGYDQLAGESTYESYGRVGHSPARYDVPGRVVLDRSNSFLWQQSNVSGLVYLVEQSYKPAQEVGWASIGNVLTAIQIREAVERDVLIPWNKWRPEEFKDLHTLHAADRGGFTFQPEVGLHEDVYEVDFASLYPRIICEFNISPDTILCDCHPDRTTVPELDYNVCAEDGFLGDVLQPLLDDRAAIKDELAARESRSFERNKPATDTDSHEGIDVDLTTSADDLAAISGALKWILVSCFGYQGYRNSKFGRIECHEAINAVARDVLLTAKEAAEQRGWRVVHGIVDSLWLTPVAEDAAPIDEVTETVSDAIGISLDLESRYDWVAFVPQSDSPAGALTRYFGKRPDGGFKVRGIAARQRSTPPFVESVQRDLLEVVDETRDPQAVADRLRTAIGRLQTKQVDPADLVIRKRVSQSLAEYSQRTRTVAALQRHRLRGVERHPGQDVRFVVVDDDADGRERVRLSFEDVPDYDADFYATLLIRAAESLTAPLGWDRTDLRRYLGGEENHELASFAQGPSSAG
ncbi:type B DNA-directed DNA polymerase [Halobacteriales archaeon Cl-PHB]